jgi:signal transduction histidine kinase
MNRFFHSIKFKLALTFAIFGAVVILILSFGLYFTAHNLGERLMDETLHAEIDDYISRRSRNLNSIPPSTISIQGYVLVNNQNHQEIPVEVRGLDEGTYRLSINNTPYRVAVANRNNERYFMLFNEQRQRNREETFIYYLIVGTLIMILLSAWAGWWLAGRGVAPITELTRRVSQASPQDNADTVSEGFENNEIGRLAQVFSAYLKRMRAFIERERNFTTDVSHELRTPLTIVQGVLELIEDDNQLPEKLQKRIAKIARANRDMINLTSGLLLMAREATDDIIVQTCDVCSAVDLAIEMNKSLLSEATSLDIIFQSHPQVAAERTLLISVVANLVRNAFTYTPSGRISVTVDDNSLTICDTGIGIRGEEIGKVFQRHFKGAASTGAGIGLSLVKRICDRYDWETVIESLEGEGTKVKLVFKPEGVRNFV